MTIFMIEYYIMQIIIAIKSMVIEIADILIKKYRKQNLIDFY